MYVPRAFQVRLPIQRASYPPPAAAADALLTPKPAKPKASRKPLSAVEVNSVMRLWRR
jgi:hypothetical protein